MLANYHTHCTFCDGRSSMEDMVRFAIAKKLNKLGFSSHSPLPFNTCWNMNAEDFEEYILEFERLKQKYSNQIELYVGLEADYIDGIVEVPSSYYDVSKLNYLIASIHYTVPLPEGGYWCIDGKFEDFDNGLKQIFDGNIKAAIAMFYEISKKMILKGGFDIIGHFDKISLNGRRYKDFDISSTWYINLIGDLLQCIKDNHIIVEINTKSFVSSNLLFPDVSFLGLINELQVPVILSSDCHYPDNIIDGFDLVLPLLRKRGIQHTHQFTKNGWVQSMI